MFTSYGHLTQADGIAPNSVVIIPLAAMESHGPHLPLSTDGIIVDGLLERAAEFDTTEAPIYCLPTLWLIGYNEIINLPSRHYEQLSGTVPTPPRRPTARNNPHRNMHGVSSKKGHLPNMDLPILQMSKSSKLYLCDHLMAPH